MANNHTSCARKKGPASSGRPRYWETKPALSNYTAQTTDFDSTRLGGQILIFFSPVRMLRPYPLAKSDEQTVYQQQK